MTADDNGKDVSKEIKVKLATPTNLQYVGEPNESGITITWDLVESAEGYKVVRVINGSASGEINNNTATTYKDTDVKSGYTYAYKVYAYRTDETLNSLPTEATETVNVSNADITIIMPESLSEIGDVLSELEGKSITIGNDEQIKIVIKNDIAEGAYYEWILNEDFDNPIKEGDFATASSLIISEEYALKKNASDGNTTNSLVLRVTVNGKKETATGYFNVINNNSAGNLAEIKTPDNLTNNTVYYGEPIQLEAVFKNTSAEKPDVTWSSSNPDVMSVDETGLVTTLQKGEPVDITVAVNDTEEYKMITLTPYVKATGISFAAPDVNYLIMEAHTESGDANIGVHPYGSAITFNYGLNVTTPDNKEPSDTVSIEYDSSIISIDENGNIKPIAPGSTTIKASIEGGTISDTITVHVHDFDVYLDNTNVLDSGEYYSGPFAKKTLTLSSVNQNEQLLNDLVFTWCIAGNKNTTTDYSGFSVTGSGLSGTIDQDWNVNSHLITIIITNKYNSEDICKIGFNANYS